jgi:hypothetical protein
MDFATPNDILNAIRAAVITRKHVKQIIADVKAKKEDKSIAEKYRKF